MSSGAPEVPMGSGQHPVVVVSLASGNLAASTAFYSRLFGWQMLPFTSELAAALTPAGPSVSLVVDASQGAPGTVPYLRVPDVDAAIARVTGAGGSIERAPWDVPPVGRFARFRDPSGTIYGLTTATGSSPVARIPMPFGANPKPPAGAVCSLEMYAADGDAVGRYFGGLFGWGAKEMMPQYVGFDPGAGIGGVFQTHTPALPAVAYLYATDVTAKIAEIEAAGGARVGDPAPVPGLGTFGYFKDPSGTNMGLIGP